MDKKDQMIRQEIDTNFDTKSKNGENTMKVVIEVFLHLSLLLMI